MSTDPNRVKAIFLAAAELPDVAARAAYLEQVCGGDTGLRERVEALLCSHDPSGSFLGTPAAALPDPDNAGTMALGPPGTSGSPASRDHDDESESLQFLTPSARPDSLGRLGHYEVLQVLGKGGFGIVFRAFDDVLQRVVAIKMLAPQMAATSPARKRFLREARTSAAVRHENVVQVYEVGEQPLPYLVMEFIPGETLQQRLDRVGPLDVQESLRIGRQIAEGLAAAHANDLIHRDIKPGNILLEGGQYKVKITDFGLARAADDASMTQSGMIAGTPMYMAPEQAQGQTLDQRADLFSLGSVLYQMVAGRPPFRANTTVAVLKRVAEDTPRSIREVIPETPQWLCDIIAKLHAKNPADRYQSAREVADVLADCEAQLKTNSKLRDYSRIPRQTPQRSGNRRWVAAAAVVLLPIVALALMEFTGVTRLMRPQASREPNRPEIAPTQGVATKTRDQSGWVQLFNGQDLTGFAASSANWSVENGLLVGKDTSHLLARGVYKNFHARVKAKYNAGCRGLFLIGESDVYVRIGNQTNQSTGALLHYKPNTPAISGYGKQLVPPDTWFDLEVIVQGNRIIAKVNGITTADKIVDAMPRVTRPFSLDTAVAGSLLHVEKFEIKELPPEPGWAQLFNGKDLTGWKSIPNPNNNTGWTWADDVLTFKGLGDLLVTDRTDYGNFHLRLSIRCKSDSGAAIRLRDAGGLNGDRYLTGIGAGTAPNTITGGGLTVFQNKERKQTELAKKADVGPVDQWHTFEVIAVGNRFQTLVNGKPINDVIDPGNTRMSGSIALSLLRRNPLEVHFKNVEIKELPPEEPGWVPLFNNKDLTGWKSILDSKITWTWADGILTAKGAGELVTERNDYENFHLHLSVKSKIDSGARVHLRDAREPDGDHYVTAIRPHPESNTMIGGGLAVLRGMKPTGNYTNAPAGPADQWHTLEIIAVGNRIQTLVNGKPVTDVTDRDQTRTRCSIVLSLYFHNPQEVHFRNVEIKELPPDTPSPPLAIAPFDAAQAQEHQNAWARHLGVPVEIENSLGMKLRLVPPGKNAVGPGLPVESSEPFFFGSTEVTIEQFRHFVNDTSHPTTGEANKLGGMRVHAGKKTERDPKHIWSHPDFAPSDNHPVTLVTWHDAMAFCEWLSKKEGRTYRLPTQMDWRWAERAGSGSRYYSGDAMASLDAHAWLVGNSDMHTHPVRQRQPNPWGLFDIYGNAWELSYDWQSAGKPVAPELLRVGPGVSDRISFLGGGYSAGAEDVLQPAFGPANVGYSHLGIRVVLVGDLKASTLGKAARISASTWTSSDPAQPTRSGS